MFASVLTSKKCTKDTLKIGDSVTTQAWDECKSDLHYTPNKQNLAGQDATIVYIDDSDNSVQLKFVNMHPLWWNRDSVRLIAKDNVPTEWAPLTRKGSSTCGSHVVESKLHRRWACDAGCPMNKIHNGKTCSEREDFDRCQYRWPSGTSGKGDPEFRILDSKKEPTPKKSPKKKAYKKKPCGEQAAAYSPCCNTRLPGELVASIKLGERDCPTCGWRKGRCRMRSQPSGKHCNGLLINRWSSQQGVNVPTCQRCHNTD